MINILVVEDDKKLNQIVCAYLANEGYSVKGCLKPNEAYDEMYGTLFDLIISDIMVPGADGFEFAETVRSLNKTIRLVLSRNFFDFLKNLQKKTYLLFS